MFLDNVCPPLVLMTSGSGELQNAVRANQAGTATQAQQSLLQSGHHIAY